MQEFIYASLASFVISIALLFLLTRRRLLGFALDQPNARSLHTKPVPRTGGIGILCGILAGWALSGLPGWPVIAGMSILVFVSFLDDVMSLPVTIRFGVHFVAAGLFAVPVLLPSIGWIWTCVSMIFIVWMINLYNFMDGSDGLAGGMALFGFLFYAIAAWMHHSPEFVLLNMIVSMSACSFLFFNFHPAKIFMGDSGSIPLGFLAAAFGFAGWNRDLWPLWFPFLVFSPFIVDATVTLLKRLLRGEKIWQAHREHYYQRLIRAGLGHRNTALLEYALMVSVGATAVLSLRMSAPWIALGIWVFAYPVLMLKIDRLWAAQDK